ncbi:putative polyketide synthase 3 [Portunus trituberculatus]|uniref:Putative polyketide synthase 3 n=1 Tax=Portunus trituberculatus TaxID=210409 RepID=A0A5B7FEK4_PORTR|nr:putative polyketide synthase 3 [Portunus trituberculatus]
MPLYPHTAPACLSACLSACLCSSRVEQCALLFSASVQNNSTVFLPLPACLPAFLSPCLPASLPSCLPVSLPLCLSSLLQDLPVLLRDPVKQLSKPELESILALE